MTAFLDPFGIPFLTTARRRMASIGLIAMAVKRSGLTAGELQDRVTREYARAAADPRLAVIVPALWRIEAVCVSAGRRPLDHISLLASPVPEPAQAIAHVGWATGVAQRLGFDAAVLTAALDSTTDEAYRGFCWDGIGADLLVHSRPSVRVAGHAIGLIGGGAKPPDRRGWFAPFRAGLTPEQDRLVAHGLGRLILVTQRNLRAALVESQRLPAEWRAPAVQGIGFALAMMNHADLPMILERSRLIAPEIAPPFHDGLVYALVFDEWLGRGALAAWQPQAPFERELVDRARHEAALNLERGHPLAFSLSSRL